MNPVDLLVIGAGPGGFAAAIRYKQKDPKASVVVVDKAYKAGAHTLSGAAFETACLDELCPGWRTEEGSFLGDMTAVTSDEMYFLTAAGAIKVPPVLVPRGMHHAGDHLVCASQLTSWLSKVAVKAGIEIFYGFAAASLVWENDAVVGVRLVDQGLDHDRKPKSNFLKGEEVRARVTVLADGGRGVLSREYIAKVGGNLNPQVHSIGVKEVYRVPATGFQPGRVIHTLGFPARQDVFGGGFIYAMGKDLLAIGLILGLDWRYCDLDAQKELQVYKSHPFIANLLKDAKLVEAGAKTIPEGGFFAMPKLFTNGAMLVGDAAGLVNMEKIKGVHYAILSGMAAADAALARDLATYPAGLEARGVLADMRHARNFRAVFQAGLFIGAPLSLVQSLWPSRLGMHKDSQATCRGAFLKRDIKPVLDRVGLAALSGTMHREDEPSHLVIGDTAVCRRCENEFKSPCTTFCPTEVYRRKAGDIHISASNCVHCGTCSVKCPFENITWTPPEGTEGPRYKFM
jgi:electron-transferring-flavoprotein dehydrogenase